jgi:hypothetical protein
MAEKKGSPPPAGGTTPPDEQLATPTTAVMGSDDCEEAQAMKICGPVEVKPPAPAKDGTPSPPFPVSVTPTGPFDVNLQGANISDTTVQGLWELIRIRTKESEFAVYEKYIDGLLCANTQQHPKPEMPARVAAELTNANLMNGIDSYRILRIATEAFLLVHRSEIWTLPKGQRTDDSNRVGGKDLDLSAALVKFLGDGQRLPYIDLIVRGLGELDDPFCDNALLATDNLAFMELIWSYWLEEAMVVQAINAISLRFQNKRGPGDRDPLANFETHPLRPLSNLLWGYVQDDDHRLTVARRAYEYEHEYGLTLVGKAVPQIRPADRRSNFLEAFHNLLHHASIYFDRAANLTVRADGFPLLNALREVHLLLAEGAHNQFRGLTWTARVEMLIQMWLLSRRETREFLGGRQAVPYVESWMGTVDSLKRLMGWPETPVTHFRDLAVYGEKILLSIRFGNWSVSDNENEARGWAQFWKAEIQRYIHSYQAVTGVDLGATSQAMRQVNATPPSILLQQRAARQKRG